MTRLLSNCEAELEEVSKHELDQQTRRQLLIPTLEARQSEQAILLSNSEGELQEVSGDERERHQTSEGRIFLTTHHPSRRQLLIPSLFRPTKMCIFLAYVLQDSKHDTYFYTLLSWRLSLLQPRRAYHNVSEHLVCEGTDMAKRNAHSEVGLKPTRSRRVEPRKRREQLQAQCCRLSNNIATLSSEPHHESAHAALCPDKGYHEAELEVASGDEREEHQT